MTIKIDLTEGQARDLLELIDFLRREPVIKGNWVRDDLDGPPYQRYIGTRAILDAALVYKRHRPADIGVSLVPQKGDRT